MLSRATLFLLGVLLAACPRTSEPLAEPESALPQDAPPVAMDTPTVATDAAGAAETARPADRCNFAAIGLGDATPVTYQAPEGCRAQAETAAPITDEAGFQASFGCTAPSGVDFGTHRLHVVMREFSPATVGMEVVDDGAVLTFVSLQRQPEPGAYPPRPVTLPVAYLEPRSGEPRTVAAAVCTLAAD